MAGTNNTTRYASYGSNFTQVLLKTTAENSSTHLFHISNASQGEAENLLKSRSIDALIIIPQNFSAGLASEVNNSTRTAITSSVGQQAIAIAANSSTPSIPSPPSPEPASRFPPPVTSAQRLLSKAILGTSILQRRTPPYCSSLITFSQSARPL